jgi:hypothetical protein
MGVRAGRGADAESTHFRLSRFPVGKQLHAAASNSTHPDAPFAGPRRPFLHTFTAHTSPPSMDSESEHEHRDVNDVESESEEEVEETKPKSALKKPREAPVQVERPELP